MRVPLIKRLVITTCNIVFPPLAVALLTGFTSPDTLLNSVLFLLAVFPSHIHGFWVSFVYFTRKRRVREGRWPGKPHKTGIWSEKILTGGAGWDEADHLKKDSRKIGARLDIDDAKLDRMNSGRSARDERLARRSTTRSNHRQSLGTPQ